MSAHTPHVKLLVATAIALAWLAAPGHTGSAQTPADSGDRVVLVTLDGARTEEIFGGLDADVLKSTLKPPQTIEQSATYRRFWAPTAEERRRKLMPFFWSLVTEHGSIAGDARLGSTVTCATGTASRIPATPSCCSASRTTRRSPATTPCRTPSRPCSRACARG